MTAIIVVPGQLNPSDLQGYLGALQIKRSGTIRIVNVGPSPIPYDNGEVTADVETIAGLSPGANILVYRIQSLVDRVVLDAYNYAVAKHEGSVVNSSFANCETLSDAFDRGVEQSAVNGSAIGMTFVAGSGDWGPECPDTQLSNGNFIRGVNVPAAAPHVSAVGGTEAQPEPVSNEVWNICASHLSTYCTAGGGVSHVWKIPSYQKGVAGSPASRTRRNVPDISFPAFNAFGYYEGRYGYVWGTSMSSPMFVALLVQAEEACKTKFGAVNATTYAVVADHAKGAMMVDVTSGNNTYSSAIPGYNAKPGYDDASGLGSPKGFDYAAALCGKSP
ncbi:MAG: S53 family peptidase [Candidatus Eremiobacteraeota bacterium]|nr:S53 family peptidase [Candidatus Eremiobacteraeota bacterium]